MYLAGERMTVSTNPLILAEINKLEAKNILSPFIPRTEVIPSVLYLVSPFID